MRQHLSMPCRNTSLVPRLYRRTCATIVVAPRPRCCMGHWERTHIGMCYSGFHLHSNFPCCVQYCVLRRTAHTSELCVCKGPALLWYGQYASRKIRTQVKSAVRPQRYLLPWSLRPWLPQRSVSYSEKSDLRAKTSVLATSQSNSAKPDPPGKFKFSKRGIFK